MLAEKVINTNIGVGVGIVLQILGRILSTSEYAVGAIFGILLLLAGLGLFVWGCMSYAEGKGHWKGLGWLGILSFIGLIILVCLPDKQPASK